VVREKIGKGKNQFADNGGVCGMLRKPPGRTSRPPCRWRK